MRGSIREYKRGRFTCGENPSPVSIVLRTIDPPQERASLVSLPQRERGAPPMWPLLPPQLRGRLDAVESLKRQDRVGELIGAAVQHRAGEGKEFLLHRLRVRE